MNEPKRSIKFIRPWRLTDKDEAFHSGCGRYSRAIVDNEGDIIVFIDPSEDEYEVACTEEAANVIIENANR